PLTPLLTTVLFRRPPSDRESPLIRGLRAPYLPTLRWCLRWPLVPIAGATALVALSLFVFTVLGKEFLPELDEGDIWLRVTFPLGISVEGSRPYVREIRERVLRFPEVRVVTSQIGAPDDGTDPEAPDNAEFYIGLTPREDWRFASRERLVEAMDKALGDIPGKTTLFCQPLKANVHEALAGAQSRL